MLFDKLGSLFKFLKVLFFCFIIISLESSITVDKIPQFFAENRHFREPLQQCMLYENFNKKL